MGGWNAGGFGGTGSRRAESFGVILDRLGSLKADANLRAGAFVLVGFRVSKPSGTCSNLRFFAGEGL